MDDNRALIRPHLKKGAIMSHKSSTPSGQRRKSIGLWLSDAEVAVLAVFRSYLMTPSQMLCLDTRKQMLHERGLRELVRRELLVTERFRGAYSLTEDGYSAMKAAKARRVIPSLVDRVDSSCRLMQ
ncbi:MAG: hypothetical protein U0795_00390 [Pirellulales bacterium]